jgi:integrase
VQFVLHGKGAKERVLPLPRQLLELLRAYWRLDRLHRPGYIEGEPKNAWLFQGHRIGHPRSKGTAQNIYVRAVVASGISSTKS